MNRVDPTRYRQAYNQSIYHDDVEDQSVLRGEVRAWVTLAESMFSYLTDRGLPMYERHTPLEDF